MTSRNRRIGVTRALLASAAALLVGASALCAPGANAAAPAAAAEITGSVQFYGCEPDARRVRVYAVPMLATDDRTASLAPGRPRTRPDFAMLTATADAQRFTFRIALAQRASLYRLKLRIPPTLCGKVFWRGPEGGFVAPDGRVAIEGLAARSRLEVLAPRGARARWLGADDLALDGSGAMVRQLRWRTTLTDVAGGRLQVSTEPFEVGPDADGRCDSPPGLLQDSTFELTARQARQWTTLPPLDLRTVLAPSRAGAQAQTTRLLAGAPLYLRVVPVASDGSLHCQASRDGTSSWVVLAHVGGRLLPESPPPPPPDVLQAGLGNQYAPPARIFKNDHPHLGEYAVRLIKDYYLDPNALSPVCTLDEVACAILYNVSGVHAGDTLPAGNRYWIHPGSSSDPVGDFIEGWGEIISAAVDGLGFLVTQLSKVWNDIKQGIVKVLADAVSLSGYQCDADCERFIEGGIDVGLASMGLPPSLPNWDALVDQGFEYLAAEAASQLPVQVPGEEDFLAAKAKAIVEQVIAQVKDKRGVSGHSWFVADLGLDPAVVVLNLVHVGSDPQPPRAILTAGSDLFLPGTTVLPTRWPSSLVPGVQFLSVPITLRPNTSGFKPAAKPVGDWSKEELTILAKDWWLAHRYLKSGCTVLGFTVVDYVPGSDQQPIFYVSSSPLTATAIVPPQMPHSFDPGSIAVCIPS